jgi:precorrin-3B C17-methyltransferase
MTRSGVVHVIGIGPGERSLMTPRACEILARCEVIVGYSGYLALIADLTAGKDTYALPLGEEVGRARLALDQARRGRTVGVVSSGDPGIYGMAGVVLELLEGLPEADRPEVLVVPGLSAVNAAAALLGAPLGHDFAVISLSDLLTPWELIEKRLSAAAAADFVVVLLNPKSRQRTWQLGRACDLILCQRAGETPVGIVRNAYRPEQAVEVTTLGQLPAAAVDMFTTVIVGNSQTRCFQSRLVTPRGIVRSP